MTIAAWISALGVVAGPPLDGVHRVELESGHYLIARSEAVPEDARLPLVVCLHGTDDRAEDALAFWRSLDAQLPCTFAAPQGSFAGWRESDLPLLRQMLEHLQTNVAFDPRRVLLAGHSAGGAMAFHLLYAEGFPATAVAVTANYVPPNVTLEAAKARADVPVFYAVGVQDLNHARMREGAGLLREAGVQITMVRPDIGHVQDRAVSQEAMRWFEGVCRERAQSAIDEARRSAEREASIGPVLADLEQIAANERAHFPDQVSTARDLARDLERPGWDRLERAERLAGAGRFGEARAEYLAIEQAFDPASLAARARAARLKLEARPAVGLSPGSLKEGEEAQAERLWNLIEQAVEASDKPKAAEYCRELLDRYPRSAKADEAATMLRSLQGSGV